VPGKPVPDAYVEATVPFLSAQVTAMVRLQQITGMRSGEVTIMRGRDIDTAGKVWVYTPATHQTEHHGHAIYLGPKAQELVRPFLKADLTAYLFDPRDAVKAHNEKRRRERKTPMTPSQAGRRPKLRPRRTPKDHYTSES